MGEQLVRLRYSLRPKKYVERQGKNGNIWNELTQSAEKEAGYNSMIGNTIELTTATWDNTNDTNTANTYSTPSRTLYIPLQFWLNYWPEKQRTSNEKDSLMKFAKHSLILIQSTSQFLSINIYAVASKLILLICDTFKLREPPKAVKY